MFLVKCGKKFYELTNTNVYTLCPDCNDVHQVDIVGLLSDGLNDLENVLLEPGRDGTINRLLQRIHFRRGGTTTSALAD